MNSNISSVTRMVALTVALAWAIPFAAVPAAGEDKGGEDKAALKVARWLILGPQLIQLPAFHGDDYGVEQWLSEPSLPLEHQWPDDGATAPWPGGTTSTWNAMAAPDDTLTLGTGEADGPAAAWLATWIDADRFVNATLTIDSPHLLRVLVDGKEVATKTTTDAEGAASAELSLDAGHHRMMVLAVKDPGHEAPWTLDTTLKLDAAFTDNVRFTTKAKRPLAIDDLLAPARPQSVDLSHDGRWLAVNMRSPAAPTEGAERWLEIYEVATGRLAHSLRQSLGGFEWSPSSADSFVYAAARGKEHDILLGRVGEGAVQFVARGVEDFSDVVFADADTLILSVTETPEADERPAKRYRDLPDRWSGRRSLTHLYALELDGTRTRLTVGSAFEELQDVHPKGDRLLLSQESYDRLGRPFSTTTLVELDLSTLEPRTVAKLDWFGSALYSPEGSQALVLGSPALFDDAGNVLENRIANDYDTQAYLMDLATGDAEALSRDLAPTIQGARWPAAGQPHFRVEDRSWHRLMRLDPESGAFETLETGSDTFNSFDVTADSAAWIGSGMNDPHTVWVRSQGTTRRLMTPAPERFDGIDFGATKDWIFTSKAGDEILGRVYLPPGVDTEATKRYPMIVYYYGGTSPVTRDFGGRYPKEWWAAQGYVVYVLQPSGSTGFGQEFSARHVNAWGQQTADEILEGTRLFLDAHDFVDPERVGSIGASYGGFMTMYLQTQSSIFNAAVSHAGISNIASYWGRGWWGYLYSDAASAGSYPWNAKDLYVGQSPLYQADKINTPMLLLHGNADVNVPPVESHQMYTALKVLGKEVELIEIDGADHAIIDLDKRRLWSRTILAWFDRHLKKEPEMWQHLWGTEEKPKG